jgi:hypothetical protein
LNLRRSEMADLPWDNLKPTTDPNLSRAIRVDEKHPHDFFWAISHDGHPQLICRLPVKNVISEKDIPKFRILKINVAGTEDESYSIIELVDTNQKDLFLILCKSLIDSVRNIARAELVPTVMLQQINRWQKLLGKGISGRVLTFEDQIGLIGELIFIRDYLLKRYALSEIPPSWAAALEHPQDFVLPDGTTVEIKCRQTTSPESLSISSQWQLNQESSLLYLVAFSIHSSSSEQEESFSLYEIVEQIREQFKSDEIAFDGFEGALLQRGYIDNKVEYSKTIWKLANTQCFSVVDDFPKITPKCLSLGILNVNYIISIPACSGFRKDINEIFS